MSENRVEISWTDTNAGHAIYAVSARAGQPFRSIATLPAGSTSYVDNQIANGTIYEYMIVATTAADVPAVSEIVYGATASAAPTDLVATISSGVVNLSWDDHTGGAVSYVIEWSYDDLHFTDIDSVYKGSTSYTVGPNFGAALQTPSFAPWEFQTPWVPYTWVSDIPLHFLGVSTSPLHLGV